MRPQSFMIAQGERLALPITVTDAAGEPLDLTSATPSFGMARSAGDEIVAGTADSSATATVRDPETDGIVDVTIAGSITDTLIGTYEWECRATDIVSESVVIARGYLTVTERVIIA